MCFIVTIFNKFKIILLYMVIICDFFAFLLHIPKFHFEVKAWPILHNPFNNPLTPNFKNWLIFISMFFLLYEDHGIIFFQTYIQKMNISANFGGSWGFNYAIFFLENYLHKPIHVWSKNDCVMCFRMSGDFISNSTLQLIYHVDMVNARNGHYELIIFYNASWEVDQNMLPQTKHTK